MSAYLNPQIRKTTHNSPRESLVHIGALGFFLIFLGLAAPFAYGGRTLDRSVVTINNDLILESDIARFKKKLESKNFRELFGNIDPKTLETREGMLQLMIEERVLDQQVKKLDLQASPQEVEAQIQLVSRRNGITQDQLTERLKQLGTSFSDYRDAIRRQLERKNLIEREILPSIEISEEQLRDFFRRSQSGGDGTEYKIAQILIQGTDKKAKAKANAVYDEVSKSPQDWEKHVKEYSQDSDSLESGGVLGSFSPSQLAREFREVVPKTPVGTLSKPVQTKIGFHILKVLSTHASEFASVPPEKKEAVRQQLKSLELEKKMTAWLEKKKNDAQIKRFDVAKNPSEVKK